MKLILLVLALIDLAALAGSSHLFHLPWSATVGLVLVGSSLYLIGYAEAKL